MCSRRSSVASYGRLGCSARCDAMGTMLRNKLQFAKCIADTQCNRVEAKSIVRLARAPPFAVRLARAPVHTYTRSASRRPHTRNGERCPRVGCRSSPS